VFDIVQHSWSVLDEPLHASPQFRITHRAVMRALAPLRSWLAADPAAARRLSDAAALDVRDPRLLPALLLGSAAAANPQGMVLVASRNARRTRDNVRAGLDPAMADAGRRFSEALLAEPSRPAPH
jgi:hypothetical protein